MDKSREIDLMEMHDIFNDSKQPMSERRLAYDAFSRLQAKIKDKKLTSLRSRLIGAIESHDLKERRKIEEQIIEYNNRVYHGR